MANPVREVQQLGQSIWIDSISRGMIVSGELDRLVGLGVTGVTSNPTIFERAISAGADYDAGLALLERQGVDVHQAYEALVLEDITAAADSLRDVYDATGGTDGYVSLEVDPSLAHATDETVAEGQRLFATLGRPNVMIKVPATPEGIPAVRRLIGEGVNVNVTLIFSLEAYQMAREAYVAGLEDLARAGGPVERVASVASFFVSRVDTAVDALLEERANNGEQPLSGLLGKAAVANAKLAYQAFKETFASERFAVLRGMNARVQRPLWASTSTKNPAYHDLLYVEPLIGAHTVNTMPPATLTGFLDHGRAEATLERGVDDARGTMAALEAAGVSLESVTSSLLADGVQAFVDSFDGLMRNLREKKASLTASNRVYSGVSLGEHISGVETTLHDLQEREIAARIWRKDHTVWKSDPTEIADRLGWLDITEDMRLRLPELQRFASEVRAQGFAHVVLLGMGGTSLGPEVLRQTFGPAPGCPELVVLDSTLPDRVQAVSEAVDPARTLFLVSSKSGATTETICLYRYFRELVDRCVGRPTAGSRFVAITDAGTPLDRLARDEGLRRSFLNPPDVGGRYSVLSYFGLVPSVLTGVDVAALLDRADEMRDQCGLSTPAHDPGTWLGAAIGTLARQGRDKVTIVTSPSVSSFGLWVEQMLAESTGKENKGVVPVESEPLADPASYGSDRFFVHLRLSGDDNSAVDAAVARIESAGMPVLRLELRDKHDLGAEFFRWEFATAVAGSILGIHPFDQPDVQVAKDQTSQVLSEYQETGRLPAVEVRTSLSALLEEAHAGDYLAILAYLPEDPEVRQALREIRQQVLERCSIASTVGFGPRYLHSTGQLHKGGPDTGVYLHLTADPCADMPVPGEPFTFSVLFQAQALGDLRTLQSLGRRVAHLHLGQDVATSLRRLARELA